MGHRRDIGDHLVDGEVVLSRASGIGILSIGILSIGILSERGSQGGDRPFRHAVLELQDALKKARGLPFGRASPSFHVIQLAGALTKARNQSCALFGLRLGLGQGSAAASSLDADVRHGSKAKFWGKCSLVAVEVDRIRAYCCRRQLLRAGLCLTAQCTPAVRSS